MNQFSSKELADKYGSQIVRFIGDNHYDGLDFVTAVRNCTKFLNRLEGCPIKTDTLQTAEVLVRIAMNPAAHLRIFDQDGECMIAAKQRELVRVEVMLPVYLDIVAPEGMTETDFKRACISKLAEFATNTQDNLTDLESVLPHCGAVLSMEPRVGGLSITDAIPYNPEKHRKVCQIF